MASYKTGIESKQKIYSTARELFNSIGFTKANIWLISKFVFSLKIYALKTH